MTLAVVPGLAASTAGELLASPLAATTVTATMQARYAHAICDEFASNKWAWLGCSFVKWFAQMWLMDFVVLPMLGAPLQPTVVPLHALEPEHVDFDGVSQPKQEYWTRNGTEERTAKEEEWKRKFNETRQQRNQPGTCGPFGAGAVPWYGAVAFPSAPKLPTLSPFDNETAGNFDCAARVGAILHLVPDAITLGFGLFGTLVGFPSFALFVGYVLSWTLHVIIAMLNVSLVTMCYGLSALFGFHGRMEFAWGVWLSLGMFLELLVLGSLVFAVIGTPIQAAIWYWTNQPEPFQRKHEKRLRWSVRFWLIIYNQWKQMIVWLIWMTTFSFLLLVRLVRRLAPMIIGLPVLFFKGVTGGQPDDASCLGCNALRKDLKETRDEVKKLKALITAKISKTDDAIASEHARCGSDGSESDTSASSRASTLRSAVKKALQTSASKLKCHRCGDLGHRKKDCPSADQKKDGMVANKDKEGKKKRPTKTQVQGGGGFVRELVDGLREFVL